MIFPKEIASQKEIFPEKINALLEDHLDSILLAVKKGKISVGWLVEKAGMKGAQVGQAQVSPVHGNFVVNLGGASAHDVLTLVEQIKEKVYDTSGIELHEEIQII